MLRIGALEPLAKICSVMSSSMERIGKLAALMSDADAIRVELRNIVQQPISTRQMAESVLL